MTAPEDDFVAQTSRMLDHMQNPDHPKDPGIAAAIDVDAAGRALFERAQMVARAAEEPTAREAAEAIVYDLAAADSLVHDGDLLGGLLTYCALCGASAEGHLDDIEHNAACLISRAREWQAAHPPNPSAEA